MEKKNEHKHFNRIKEIMAHPDNTERHWTAINTMVDNYRKQFGPTKLWAALEVKFMNYKLDFLGL